MGNIFNGSATPKDQKKGKTDDNEKPSGLVNMEEIALSALKKHLHKSMNMTPESFFRICDTKYEQEFDYQTFRDRSSYYHIP